MIQNGCSQPGELALNHVFPAGNPSAWPQVNESSRDQTKLSRKDLTRAVFQALNRSGSGCLTFDEMKPFAKHTGILAGCLFLAVIIDFVTHFHRCCQFVFTLECLEFQVSSFQLQSLLCSHCLAVGHSIGGPGKSIKVSSLI